MVCYTENHERPFTEQPPRWTWWRMCTWGSFKAAIWISPVEGHVCTNLVAKNLPKPRPQKRQKDEHKAEHKANTANKEANKCLHRCYCQKPPNPTIYCSFLKLIQGFHHIPTGHASAAQKNLQNLSVEWGGGLKKMKQQDWPFVFLKKD